MGAIWLVESILNTDANGKKHVLKLSKSTGAAAGYPRNLLAAVRLILPEISASFGRISIFA